MRRPTYIAGPYAAETPEAIAANVARAVALGRLATSWDLAPIVPHAMGWLGAHGPRDESAPDVRPAAIGCGVALAAMVGRCGGNLWAILRPDNTPSVGTHDEIEAYIRARRAAYGHGPGAGRLIRYRWDRWLLELDGNGIAVQEVTP